MPAELRALRDELANKLATHISISGQNRFNPDVAIAAKKGFDACYSAMKERERIAVEALEYYANKENYKELPIITMPGHPRISTVQYGNGRRAREALARLREPFNKERT